ncbi:MAG: hypothetical protein QNJ94_05530 [Alphaproteobacteria bacterium]|nr:hypothetical protein [Alphaproteobacteria bacterium]
MPYSLEQFKQADAITRGHLLIEALGGYKTQTGRQLPLGCSVASTDVAGLWQDRNMLHEIESWLGLHCRGFVVDIGEEGAGVFIDMGPAKHKRPSISILSEESECEARAVAIISYCRQYGPQPGASTPTPSNTEPETDS